MSQSNIEHYTLAPSYLHTSPNYTITSSDLYSPELTDSNNIEHIKTKEFPQGSSI